MLMCVQRSKWLSVQSKEKTQQQKRKQNEKDSWGSNKKYCSHEKTFQAAAKKNAAMKECLCVWSHMENIDSREFKRAKFK